MTRDLAIWAGVAAADRFSAPQREQLTHALSDRLAPHADGATLVTCHRVEVYGVAEEDASPALPPSATLPPLTMLHGDAAVRHLLRLAVGLESAVIGEDQVLHQVRLVLAELRERQADPRLVRLFELAVGAGRRARARHPAADRNLGDLAVRWLERRTGPLAGRPVVVAGSGPMGRLAATALARRRADVVVASRSVAHAHEIGDRIGAATTDLADGANRAASATAVVVALAGPWLEFRPANVLPVVDLSFPAALSDQARAPLGDAFADVDRIFREAGSFQADGAVSLDFRAGAEAIVDEVVAAYRAWNAGRASVSTLRALRDRSETRRNAELQRLLRRLPELGPRERELVEAFSQRLVADFLHEPSAALRDDVDGSAARAATRLFGL